MSSIFGGVIGIILLIAGLLIIFYLVKYYENQNICIDSNISSPSNVSAKVSGASVILTWNGVNNVDGYNIYQSLDSSFKPSNDDLIKSVSGANTYTVSGLSVGQNYYFLITSYKNKCSSLPAPKTPLKVGINFETSAIMPILPSSCGALVKALIGTTDRACPYSFDSKNNNNKNGGKQIGFYYDTNITPNKQFTLNYNGNIIPSNITNTCIYYNNDYTYSKHNSVLCYTDCSSIPDRYKKWQILPGNGNNDFYIKLQQSNTYVITDADVIADYVQGPFTLPNKPNQNCDTLPFWVNYTG